MEQLRWLGALCSPAVGMQGGLLVGLLIAGAAGSVMHCVPMCGIFVLGQVGDRMGRLPQSRLCEFQRVRNGLLLPYHLGRLTTYTALGAASAGSMSLLGRADWARPLSAAFLVVAAALFVRHSTGRFMGAKWSDWTPAWWAYLLGRVTACIPRGSAAAEFILGLALGFLPCGFLYAAMAAAAASGQPWLGGASMLAFGLGTVPSLVVVGVAGQAAGRRWNQGITSAAPFVLAANAILLLVLAWRTLA